MRFEKIQASNVCPLRSRLYNNLGTKLGSKLDANLRAYCVKLSYTTSMAQKKKPRSVKQGKSKNNIDLHASSTPIWYLPEAPLGAAVRYVASLSSRFNWVGIYVLKGKTLELGPYIGAKTDHTRIPVGRGVCGLAVSENQDQNVPDVRNHGNYLACSIETRSELVVLIRDRDGEILGQIDIDSHSEAAFGHDEEKAVKQVAKELGELWPA